jgi:hypothetical protein
VLGRPPSLSCLVRVVASSQCHMAGVRGCGTYLAVPLVFISLPHLIPLLLSFAVGDRYEA